MVIVLDRYKFEPDGESAREQQVRSSKLTVAFSQSSSSSNEVQCCWQQDAGGAPTIGQKLVAAEAQLAKLRRSSAAAQALVVHTTAVSETVLKEAGLKLRGGRKRKALVEHNAAAWAQGKRDADQIDLNQNALGGPKRPKDIGQ